MDLTRPVSIALLFLSLALPACKKVIHPDLNHAEPQIVIEGVINSTPGPYHVKISKTVNFESSNIFPPVSGATVRITDSTNGQTAILSESTLGVYSTSAIAGVPKHTYLLQVQAEGQQYTARSTMPALVPLDSITFVQNLDFNNKSVINAVVNFKDPPGLGNYYGFTEFVNRVQMPDIFVFEDRLSDARYIRQTLFNDTSRLHTGDTLVVEMYGVDKNNYDYFNTLLQVTGNNSFRSATPANPNSNISNGALGYFTARTLTQKKIRVY